MQSSCARPRRALGAGGRRRRPLLQRGLLRVLGAVEDPGQAFPQGPMAGGQPAARLPQEKDRPFPCLVPREQEKGQRGGEEAREGPHQAGSPCPPPSPPRDARWSASSALAPVAVLRGTTQKGDPGQPARSPRKASSALLLARQMKDSCPQLAQGWGAASPQEAEETASAARQSRVLGSRNYTHLCSLSRVRHSAAPWTVAHQAPLSTGSPRQEFWNGCHLLLWGSFRPGD